MITKELLKEKELQKEIKKLEARLEKMKSIQHKAGNKSRIEKLCDWLITTKCFKKKDGGGCVVYTRVSDVRIGRARDRYKLIFKEEEVLFNSTFKECYSCSVKQYERCLESPDSEYNDFSFIREGQKKIDNSEFQRAWDTVVIPIIDATVR